MWFDKLINGVSNELKVELTKKDHEIKDLKQLIDELFSKEHEAKAVYHTMAEEFEHKIKLLETKNAQLESTISNLQAIIADLKSMGKKKHHPKNDSDLQESN